MKRGLTIHSVFALAAFTGCFDALSARAAEPKVTYAEHILPILRNSCLNCHNPDKHKAGLDLSTYQAAMAGSDSGKVIEPGDPEKSLLYRLIMHTDEPPMPAKADKLPDSQIELFKKWIAGNAPENSGSTGPAKMNEIPDAPVLAEEKPAGPPPMPHDLALDPVVRTRKPGTVACLAASPWAPLVAVTSQKEVLLYNTETLDLAGVLPFPEGFPSTLRFSRSGKLLLAGGGVGAKSGRVVVWDVETGRRVIEAGDEFDTVLAADLSPDHTIVALGGPGRLVKLYSAKDGKLITKLKKHTDWVTAMSFTADGKMLVTGDRAGGVLVWDAQGHELFTLTGHKDGITGVSCYGSTAATSSLDGTVRMWNLKDGTQIKSWGAHKDGVMSVEILHDGRIVTSGRDKLAKLWDKTGNPIGAFEPFQDFAMCATAAGDRIIAADWTGEIRVWNAATKVRVGVLTPNPPTLAERLDAASKHLAEIQAQHDQRMAECTKTEANAKQLAEICAKMAASVGEKEAALKSAKAQLDTFTKKWEELNRALQGAGETEAVATARRNVTLAKESLANLTREFEATRTALPQETVRFKEAAQIADKVKGAFGGLERPLALAKSDVAKWTAAQVNVTLAAARRRLDECKANYEKVVEMKHPAFSEFETAVQKLSAAEKALATAPERIKAGEAAVVQSAANIEKAKAAVKAAEVLIVQKQALVQLSGSFSATLKAEVAMAPDDKVLGEAAGHAGVTADLLQKNLAQAREAAVARATDVENALLAASATQEALARAQREAKAGPEMVTRLRQAMEEVGGRTASARDAAKVAIEQAAVPMNRAKEEVDQLTAQYEKLQKLAQPVG